MKKLVVLVVLAAACGGGKKSETTPVNTEPDGNDTSEPPDNSQAMVTPDTMEEIQRMFQRKGNAVSRCLATVVDNKELPKNSRGKITLEVTIAPAGTVSNVKILKSALESKPLHDCVVERVKEIQFPRVPAPYPTTYTYAFEAM